MPDLDDRETQRKILKILQEADHESLSADYFGAISMSPSESGDKAPCVTFVMCREDGNAIGKIMGDREEVEEICQSLLIAAEHAFGPRKKPQYDA
jgi:hypothetical protein